MVNKSKRVVFLLTFCIACAVCAVAPSQAMIHTVTNAADLNLAISSLVPGDKIVFINNTTISAPINLNGLTDITLVMAEDPTKIGPGTVGIGGFNFTNNASVRISALGSTCISISNSQRIQIVGFRMRCGDGIHVQNSQDIRLLGNKINATSAGIRLDNATRTVVASNLIQKHGNTSTLSIGIGLSGGLDNLLFDNRVKDALDAGIIVDGNAGRTSTINSLVEQTGATPSIGIRDGGQQSCLLRNEAGGGIHPFQIGCFPATLIGNQWPAGSTVLSDFCGSSVVPPSQNDLM